MTGASRWKTRPETQDDVERIRAINVAAFGRVDEADLVEALRADPAWIEGLSIVTTTTQGVPVGYALLTRCHIGDAPALCLAPCAVMPEWQRQGAGGAAIRAALAAARAAGEVFVVVLGHPDYYPRFGFHRAADDGITLTIPVSDDALMSLSLDPDRRPPAGVVRYAAPFGID